VFSLVAVVSFLGLAVTRTALDRTAIEGQSLDSQIAEQISLNQRLRLEIARLESPARIAPLAAEMGMVYPDQHHRLLVAGVLPSDAPADPRWVGIDRPQALSAP
jgi:cell division protein FtsL